MKGKIYVAGPYRGTSKNPLINWLQRQYNIAHARIAAQRLWAEGYYVFCPHLNSANFDGICNDSLFLEAYLNFLRTGGFTAIYLLNGWQNSKGTAPEFEIAKAAGMKVRYEEDEEE